MKEKITRLCFYHGNSTRANTLIEFVREYRRNTYEYPTWYSFMRLEKIIQTLQPTLVSIKRMGIYIEYKMG